MVNENQVSVKINKDGKPIVETDTMNYAEKSDMLDSISEILNTTRSQLETAKGMMAKVGLPQFVAKIPPITASINEIRNKVIRQIDLLDQAENE
jgi:hypothetical protein